jgi:hypothetical protein
VIVPCLDMVLEDVVGVLTGSDHEAPEGALER